MAAQVKRSQTATGDDVTEVVADVTGQTAKIVRRQEDGTAWLYVPGGMAVSADEAWAVAQALVGGAA